MTEQNQEKKPGRFERFWADWRGWVWLALFFLTIVVVLSVLAWGGIIETGFGVSPADLSLGIDGERAKTLWDWMDLLLVPIALALAAAFFTWVTNKREREIEGERIKEQRKVEEQRIQEQRTIELDRSREAALQTYLDRTTVLLRDKWREWGGGFLEANIIRARTLTALRQLDGERKGLLLQFLYEAGLIGREAPGQQPKEAVVDLRWADLRKAHLAMVHLAAANLRGADLGGADLIGANLRGADLSGAFPVGADLGGADLTRANLSGAYLTRADLSAVHLREADLSGADLTKAGLSGADLGGADLSGAYLVDADLVDADLHKANLGGADLCGAKVTEEQLAQAWTLEGATMPDGTKHG